MPATFQPLPNSGFTADSVTALVLMNDNSLVLYQNESPTPVDTNVMAFQSLAVDQYLTLHTDGTLSYLPGQILSNVQAFQALSSAEVLVIHTNGDLYLYPIPMGQPVPTAPPFAADVQAVQAISDKNGPFDKQIFFLQTDGVLYYKPGASGLATPVAGPVQGLADGQVPAQPMVQAFQPLSRTEVFVLGGGNPLRGNLYHAVAPFNLNAPLQEIVGNPTRET